MKQKLLHFLKQETVLCAAWLLAALSMFLVPPDRQYLSYIDYRTLAILFCLMGVMAGLQKTGIFRWISQQLLGRVKRESHVVWLLVLLCFFSSMIVTNDVALITFVPFTFIVLGLISPESKTRLLVPVVVLQTIAANLGSMLTPIGNPQNLYLYGKADLSPGSFLWLMLPYTLLSLVLLMLCIWLLSRKGNAAITVTFSEKVPLTEKKLPLIAYGLLFALNLLTVARILPYEISLLITTIALLLLDRSIFARIDYSLLLTFAGFFIFIGNMGRLPALHDLLQQVVSGHELLAGAITSQVISNVPAALLLSGFTDHFTSLIIGVNLGGLGTLIASMASLISYKLIAREDPAIKSAYFRRFTVSNLLFLAALLLFAGWMA